MLDPFWGAAGFTLDIVTAAMGLQAAIACTIAVEEVIGDDNPKNVKGIKIKNVKTNEVIEMNLDGVFIAIGHDPATQLFKDQLEMDNEGYLVTKSDSTETNVPGVFAAGDVKDKVFRQAVTAAGMGCMAALEAEKHLSHN